MCIYVIYIYDGRICRRQIAIYLTCLPPPVLDLFVLVVERFVGGFSQHFWSCSLVNDLADAGRFGW